MARFGDVNGYEVIADYNSGMRMMDMSKKYGVSGMTIRSFLKRKNVFTGKVSRFSPQDEYNIIYDYIYGNYTISELSQKFNFSRQGIYDMLKRNKIELNVFKTDENDVLGSKLREVLYS